MNYLFTSLTSREMNYLFTSLTSREMIGDTWTAMELLPYNTLLKTTKYTHMTYC